MDSEGENYADGYYADAGEDQTSTEHTVTCDKYLIMKISIESQATKIQI
jgi:hypothetical protein